MITNDDVSACMQKVLPLRGAECGLALAGDPPVSDCAGAAFATLRLIVYENGQIRDIKEQDVCVLSAKARDASPDPIERIGDHVQHRRRADVRFEQETHLAQAGRLGTREPALNECAHRRRRALRSFARRRPLPRA